MAIQNSKSKSMTATTTMSPRTRTKRSRNNISGKRITQMAALLWVIGLSFCGWTFFSHHRQVTKMAFSSSSSFSSGGGSHVLPGLPPPSVNAGRQRSSRENLAWMKGKFQHGTASSLGGGGSYMHESNPQQQAANDELKQGFFRTPKLPSWTGTARKVLGGGDGAGPFVEPECRGFNHTILRPEHGCQVNPDTYLIFCNLEDLRIDVDKIQSDWGGEPLESVMGREEEPEFPVYEKGAFSVAKRPQFDVPTRYRGHPIMHYLGAVLNNLEYPTKKEKSKEHIETSCTEVWSGTTMFITRYEYVNLYHTMTDWWNAYFVMPRSNKQNLRVVFLDAHAQGTLDPVWKDLFGQPTFVQHLPKGGVCFEKAIFIPSGYLSPLFPDSNTQRIRCPSRSQAVEFSNFVLTSYGLQDVQRIPGKIVIIDRKPYVSHPRSKPVEFSRVLGNLDQLQSRLERISSNKVTSVDIVRFETMTFREQIQTVRQAHILIGNHGAGLSHVLFMDPKSHLLEYTQSPLDFFIFLSDWKGVQHTAVELYDETLEPGDLARTADIVESILDGSKNKMM